MVLSTPDCGSGNARSSGWTWPDHTPGPGLPGQFLLELLVPARVDIDDRNMAKAFTHLVDLPGVIGSIHEIVEVRHTPGGYHRQRDRDLAVMDRRLRNPIALDQESDFT